MKKIARNEVRDELVLMNEGFQILTKGQVKVKLLSGFSKGEIVKAGVDWVCFGTVEIENAQKFAQWITKAAEAAANFKYNGYTIA